LRRPRLISKSRCRRSRPQSSPSSNPCTVSVDTRDSFFAQCRLTTSRRTAPHSAFVRNLVFELTEEHLQKAFAKYGQIESTFIARDPRGMSKG